MVTITATSTPKPPLAVIQRSAFRDEGSLFDFNHAAQSILRRPLYTEFGNDVSFPRKKSSKDARYLRLKVSCVLSFNTTV